MVCVRAASVTFHQCKVRQDHQDELKVHFGDCMKVTCPVAKWKNPAPKAMTFFSPTILHKERKR